MLFLNIKSEFAYLVFIHKSTFVLVHSAISSDAFGHLICDAFLFILGIMFGDHHHMTLLLKDLMTFVFVDNVIQCHIDGYILCVTFWSVMVIMTVIAFNQWGQIKHHQERQCKQKL